MVVLDAQLFLQPQIVPYKANCIDCATVSSVSARLTDNYDNRGVTHAPTNSLTVTEVLFIHREIMWANFVLEKVK